MVCVCVCWKGGLSCTHESHVGVLHPSQTHIPACLSLPLSLPLVPSYIVTAACSLSRGGQHQPCWSSRPAMLGAVGVLQLLLSQMRNLAAARWLSAAGSAATFGYVAIIFGLSAANVGSFSRGRPARPLAAVFTAMQFLKAPRSETPCHDDKLTRAGLPCCPLLLRLSAAGRVHAGGCWQGAGARCLVHHSRGWQAAAGCSL